MQAHTVNHASAKVRKNYAIIRICPHVQLWTQPEVADTHFMVKCAECGLVEWDGQWLPPRDERTGKFVKASTGQPTGAAVSGEAEKK